MCQLKGTDCSIADRSSAVSCGAAVLVTLSTLGSKILPLFETGKSSHYFITV